MTVRFGNHRLGFYGECLRYADDRVRGAYQWRHLVFTFALSGIPDFVLYTPF